MRSSVVHHPRHHQNIFRSDQREKIYQTFISVSSWSVTGGAKVPRWYRSPYGRQERIQISQTFRFRDIPIIPAFCISVRYFHGKSVSWLMKVFENILLQQNMCSDRIYFCIVKQYMLYNEKHRTTSTVGTFFWQKYAMLLSISCEKYDHWSIGDILHLSAIFYNLPHFTALLDSSW